MSNESNSSPEINPNNGPEQAKKNGAPAPEVEQGGAPAGAAKPEVNAAEEQRSPDEIIAGLCAEVADLKDRLLRAHAEMDNVRKNAENERKLTAKYAIAKFANDIVGLADNFQRAIGAVPAGAADQDPALKSFLEGVTMTEREFLNVLERYGIRQIDPRDQTFNPHLHQAVMEMEKPEVAAGTIVQVFQPGYTIEERLLRPAMVVVAKGGPKPSKPAEAAMAAAPDQTTVAVEAPANDDTPPNGAKGQAKPDS